MRGVRRKYLTLIAVFLIALIVRGCVSVVSGLRDFARSYERNESLWSAACEGNSRAVRRWLAEGASPDYTADGTFTVLMCAWSSGDKATIEAVLEARPDLIGPLIYAARNDDAEFARLLLAHGADPNARDHEGVPIVERARQSKGGKVHRLLKEALSKREPSAPKVSR
jgi:ankyrin repeat protein